MRRRRERGDGLALPRLGRYIGQDKTRDSGRGASGGSYSHDRGRVDLRGNATRSILM